MGCRLRPLFVELWRESRTPDTGIPFISAPCYISNPPSTTFRGIMEGVQDPRHRYPPVIYSPLLYLPPLLCLPPVIYAPCYIYPTTLIKYNYIYATIVVFLPYYIFPITSTSPDISTHFNMYNLLFTCLIISFLLHLLHLSYYIYVPCYIYPLLYV